MQNKEQKLKVENIKKLLLKNEFEKARDLLAEFVLEGDIKEEKFWQEYINQKEKNFYLQKLFLYFKRGNKELIEESLSKVHYLLSDEEILSLEKFQENKNWDFLYAQFQDLVPGFYWFKLKNNFNKNKKELNKKNVKNSQEDKKNVKKEKKLKQKKSSSLKNKISSLEKKIRSFFKTKKSISEEDLFQKTEEVLNKKKIKKREERVVKNYDKEKIISDSEKTEEDIVENILKTEKNKIEVKKEEKREDKLQKIAKRFKGSADDTLLSRNPLLPFILYTKNFMIFSIFLFLFSVFAFYLQTDENNFVLGYFGQKNIASLDLELKDKLSESQENIKVYNTRLKNLEQGYIDNQIKINIEEIQSKKINWLMLKEELEKATLDAFSYNDVLDYIVYNSYTGNIENQEFIISGEIKEPAGRVYLLLSKLVKAINKHPLFSGAEVKSFNKSENSNEEIGGYQTSFILNLKYHQ